LPCVRPPFMPHSQHSRAYAPVIHGLFDGTV
jgi:hypothetical protein